MLRCNQGLNWLVLVFGLWVVACAASSEDGSSVAARRLVIDPGTFDLIRSAETQDPAWMKSLSLDHVGPRIILQQPDDGSAFWADEPVTVHIEFLPAADGSAPDMTTLNVRVWKGWFGRDITEAVGPYVEDVAIRVPAVDFSGHTGNFRFQIRIRDNRGRESEAEFRVRIKT